MNSLFRFFLLLLAFAACVATPALGATWTYEHDLYITGTAPAGYNAGDSFRGVEFAWHGDSDVPGSGVARRVDAVKANGTAWESAPGVPYIDCYAVVLNGGDDTYVNVRWNIPKTGWPASWPSAVYCRATDSSWPGELAELKINLLPRLFAGGNYSTAIPNLTTGSGGVPLVVTLDDSYGDGVSGWGFGKLPAGNYQESCVQARSGTAPNSPVRPGQWCYADEGGVGVDDMLRLEADTNAGAVGGTTSYCHINRNGTLVAHKVQLVVN